MMAYVINLDKRGDRWARMQEVWEPYFDLVRVSAVDLPGNGAGGCKMSHHMVAAKFLEDYELIVVLEDDAIPTPAFEEIGMRCLAEAKNFVDEWNFVNCGPYLDLTELTWKRAKLCPTKSTYFLRADYSHQTHMVIYNRQTLPLLREALRSPLPLDMFLGWAANKQWVPIHLLATQSDSPSDIPKPVCDANQLYALSEKMLEDAVNKNKV